MKIFRTISLAVLALTALAPLTSVFAGSSSQSEAPAVTALTRPCLYQLPVKGRLKVVNLNHVLHMAIEESDEHYVLRLWMPLASSYQMPIITSKDPAVLEKIMQQIMIAAKVC